jgi:hypothetical protein
MEIESLIQKYLNELPQQVGILQHKYAKIADTEERAKQEKELASYERRMKEGFELLSTLDEEMLGIMKNIRDASPSLLQKNAERYKAALIEHRKKHAISFSAEESEALQNILRAMALNHNTQSVALLRKNGIHPASELWLSDRKTTANPMDIILGMDRYCFFTHGFSLSNYGAQNVLVKNKLIENADTIVSTVDIFKLVLIATGKSIPCAVSTKDWVSSLGEYSKQLFAGSQFWALKAEYILTFFKNADEYHAFAAKHFYENHSEMAPAGEQPFLGEVKVRGVIGPECMV